MSLWSCFGVASMDLNCFNVSVVRCSRNSRCSVLSCFLSFRIASFDILFRVGQVACVELGTVGNSMVGAKLRASVRRLFNWFLRIGRCCGGVCSGAAYVRVWVRAPSSRIVFRSLISFWE